MRWYRWVSIALFALGLWTSQPVHPARAEQQSPAVTIDAPIVILGEVQPLMPLPMRVALPGGPSGDVHVVITDVTGAIVSTTTVTLVNGVGETTVIPRGRGGPQRADVWSATTGQLLVRVEGVYTLAPHTSVRTGIERYDQFFPKAELLMGGAWLEIPFGEGKVRGYRSPDSPMIWLRDHVYQMRGARYFDGELISTLDAFATLQASNGSFPDYLPRAPWTTTAYRTPVESDVEFLFIQGVYQAWQAGAGDDFARRHLDGMRRAATYSLQDPWRWDPVRGLVRRPFTIDTWDFEVLPGGGPHHEITPATRWGIFHGDNTGMAQSLRMLATLEERVGDPALAGVWRTVADGIMERLNAVSWNGNFYRHFVFDQPTEIPGVDVNQQLSLSNAYALNRGVLTAAQQEAIIQSYISRRRPGAFAEWYSIDPAFPAGTLGLGGRSGERPGEYVNGGLMPMVGGELAAGAFQIGRPSYGFAQLDYFWLGMLSKGESYLWYTPDGGAGIGTPETISTDGWGTSSMLMAFIEGAVGVVDQQDNLRVVTIAPQWSHVGLRDAYASVRYAMTNNYVAYRWHQDACWASIDVTGAQAYQIKLAIPRDTVGCSGVIQSPNGPVTVVQTPEGQVAIVQLNAAEGTVVVSW